ncbi:ribosome biogenesis GTPase Der [Buchnera aphidicola (Muscaphis stroyani)]|uniref:GTPase Der n=1 Tax=Buchnera aphidicola (Muscaphis stroyani) TaxID=1241869 RepID=A0A4D6YDB7_9GAMM|nr:ribosome biogenesis GTPase Der [Buchnera aphidicola]QCI24631.1 ribosome biogenesis GTPase Der [Buchnera aphidicola (Muscaphis stroyani)]
MLPIISLIGRTNVGKSTLFNILTKSRNALVADYPGLTRDRQYGYIFLEKQKKGILIDTAGLDIQLERIKKKAYVQTLKAIKESDLILFIVDAYDGLMPQEKNLSQFIRKYNKKIILIINKIDKSFKTSKINEFYELGFKNQHQISARCNQGISTLILKYLIPWINMNFKEKLNSQLNIKSQKENKREIKIALIGRPNVGKSTLTNAFLKKKQMITCQIPGTTLDSISTPMTHRKKNYILIDTAGTVKKNKISNVIEKFSMIKTLQSIENANVVLLIIDASTKTISNQDLSLASFIVKTGKSIVVVINKYDLLHNTEKKRFKNLIEKKLQFLFFSRIHFISALKNMGIFNILKSVNEAYINSQNKISASILTKSMHIATKKHQPPIIKGRRIKLKYAHLGSFNPLIIIIHGNQIKCLPNSYKKYLINFFYNMFKIKGALIQIKFKENLNPYISKK